MRDGTLPQPPGSGAEGPGDLVARVLDGDPGAWREIVAAYGPAVYDFAAAVRGEAAAAEVCRATFAKAMVRLGEAEGRPLRAWLFGLAREEALAGEPSAATGANPLFAAARTLGARRHALLDLLLRQGSTDEELAEALGVRTASARLVRERLLPTAEAVLAEAGGIAAYAALRPFDAPGGLLDEISSRWTGPPPRQRVDRPPSAFVPAADWNELAPLAEPSHARIIIGALAACAVILTIALALPSSPIALTRTSGPKATAELVPGAHPGSPPAGIVTVPAGSGADSPTPDRAGGGESPSPSPTRFAVAPTATPTQPASTPTPPSPTATLTATATIPATPTPQPATPTPTMASPTATPTPTQCWKALSSNLEPSNRLTIGRTGASSFIVLNNFCGPVEFSVAAAADWLAASPGGGTLEPGGAVAIGVSTSVPGPGVYEGAIAVSSADAGSFTIAVTYDASELLPGS